MMACHWQRSHLFIGSTVQFPLLGSLYFLFTLFFCLKMSAFGRKMSEMNRCKLFKLTDCLEWVGIRFALFSVNFFGWLISMEMECVMVKWCKYQLQTKTQFVFKPRSVLRNSLSCYPLPCSLVSLWMISHALATSFERTGAYSQRPYVLPYAE